MLFAEGVNNLSARKSETVQSLSDLCRLDSCKIRSDGFIVLSDCFSKSGEFGLSNHNCAGGRTCLTIKYPVWMNNDGRRNTTLVIIRSKPVNGAAQLIAVVFAYC